MHTILALTKPPIGALTKLTPANYALIFVVVTIAVVLYLVYKVAWPRDYGVPVRRRVLCRGLKVQRDQMAYVPLWWSDVQIQRAVKSHWKKTLQRSFAPSPTRASH